MKTFSSPQPTMTSRNAWQKWMSLGLLLGSMAVTGWSGVMCEEQKTAQGTRIAVTTPAYTLAIDPGNAGRIARWMPAGSRAELAHGGLGIANFTRVTGQQDFALPYEYEIKKYAQVGEPAPEKVEVILKSGTANREKLDGLEFRKTLVFRSNTPYVQARLELVNQGSAKSVLVRLYNDFRVQAEGAAAFQRGASALLNNPGSAKKWEVWKDAGEGWGGVYAGNGMHVVVKSCPETVSELVTFADDRYAAYEIRFAPCPMENGETVAVGDVFMAAVQADTAEDALKEAGAGKIYPREVRELAEAKPVDRKEEVALDQDARRILVAGWFDSPDCGYYRVEESLARMPGLAALVDRAPICASRAIQMLGFPVSARGLAKYRMIVFVDMPYFVLADASWRLVAQFARAGGTVVFVGDHAADYAGKQITEIMPARFDDAKRMEGAGKRMIMDDRGEYAPLEPTDAADPLVAGLDLGSKPQVCVHKSIAKKDAVVRLKTGRWPVLTSWQVGNGMVYSFPVCQTDKYCIYGGDQPEFQPDFFKTWDNKKLCAEPPTERERSIFLWPNYDELWRRLAGLALQGEKTPDINAFKPEWLEGGKKLRIEFTARNVPGEDRGVLSLKVPGEGQREVKDIRLKDGKGVAEIKSLPLTKDLEYVLDVVKGKEILARLDGVVGKNRTGTFDLIVGPCKGLMRVYRRDYDVPYEASFAKDAQGKLELRLVDPWGKEVWQAEIEAKGRQSGSVPLKGLAVGHYGLQAQLGKERERMEFDILADLNHRDGFYVTTLHGCGLRTDDPAEQTKIAREIAAEGLNLARNVSALWFLDPLRWPARHRRAWGDRVLLAGLVPLHYDISIVGGGGYSDAVHASDEQLREDIRKSQELFERLWGMAPEGVQTYDYDEPGHFRGESGANDCGPCNSEYTKRYGGAMPREKTDPGYYRMAKIMDQALSEALLRKGKLWRDTQSKMVLWGLTNEGSGLLEHALAMARGFGGYGMDFFSYSPGNWRQQYAFDMALAACDFNPAGLAFQIEAESFYGGTPVAAQRGQGAYSCLARGCRVLQWHEWELCRLKHDLGVDRQRYEAVKRATNETHRLGPLLAGLKRPQARLAMLVPSAAAILGEGEARERNDSALAAAYRAAQVACGHVDFLYYQHLREGKLDGYKFLLLAGNDWIDEEMLGIIGKWVAAGGTLLAIPKSGQISEELKPTRFFAETCPVKYGERLEGARVKDFAEPMPAAYAVESATGEAMYSYEDGKPAAYRFAPGSGRVVVLGFVPANARALEKIFGDLKLNPALARSNDADASAFLLRSGASDYCVVVNSEEKAKEVELSLRVAGTHAPVALDMLTGRKVEVARDGNGLVKLRVALEPFWGRAIVLLPGKPEKILLEVPERVRPGEECVCRVRVLDGQGKVIVGRLPLELAVVDGSGRTRTECGGYHATEDGVYEQKIRLGTNDPTGSWKITAVAPWGGFKAQAAFKVAN